MFKIKLFLSQIINQIALLSHYKKYMILLFPYKNKSDKNKELHCYMFKPFAWKPLWFCCIKRAQENFALIAPSRYTERGVFESQPTFCFLFLKSICSCLMDFVSLKENDSQIAEVVKRRHPHLCSFFCKLICFLPLSYGSRAFHAPQDFQRPTPVNAWIFRRPFCQNMLASYLVFQFKLVLCFIIKHKIPNSTMGPNCAKENQIKERKAIVVFESVGGSDKGPDGHRKDTLPIVEAIKKLGWHSEVIKFQNDKAEQIYHDVVTRFCGYIGRVNPGSFPDNQKTYFEVLKKLSNAGLVGMTHPDSMISFGAKSALVKLNKSGLVPADTWVYYQIEEFKKSFPISLSHNVRVLKQNRGSTGEGIWRVQVEDKRPYQKGDSLPLDTMIKCTEAVDNHVQRMQLGEFMKFCEKYIVGDNGMLVDMRFFPRIKEGEIRILMVGAHAVFVVHKKPADTQDAFSATLFSGAKYTYDSPDKWRTLVDLFLAKLPQIKTSLKQKEVPLIWTADFMLDNDENGKDKYVLGEINCSCVGFTSQLDMGIQDKVAEEAIRQCVELQ